jgi:hypothetical protein
LLPGPQVRKQFFFLLYPALTPRLDGLLIIRRSLVSEIAQGRLFAQALQPL